MIVTSNHGKHFGGVQLKIGPHNDFWEAISYSLSLWRKWSARYIPCHTASANCLDMPVRQVIGTACPRSSQTWLSEERSDKPVWQLVGWLCPRTAWVGRSNDLSDQHVQAVIWGSANLKILHHKSSQQGWEGFSGCIICTAWNFQR
jgi:hypothetical protein